MGDVPDVFVRTTTIAEVQEASRRVRYLCMLVAYAALAHVPQTRFPVFQLLLYQRDLQVTGTRQSLASITLRLAARAGNAGH